MAISDTQKTDFLWKKIQFGVTETDITGKLGSNETIPSPVPTYSKDIWAQAENVPVPAAVVPLITEFITIQCTADPTVAGNKTWLATKTFNNLTTLSGDWIPPTFDPSYLLAVFNGNPGSGGTPLNSTANGNEWVFDYVAGTLYFPNANAGVTQIWIRGYRYIGQKGLTGSAVGGVVTVQYPNIAARDADAAVKAGQFALVVDAGDGEYAVYIANAAGPTSSWTLVSTQDSATSDAKSISNTVVPSSTTVLLGNVSSGRRALNISVEVTIPFDDPDTSLTVGTASVPNLLLDNANIDLSTVGLYAASSNYQFTGISDTVLNAYLTAATSTVGSAVVTVTFL